MFKEQTRYSRLANITKMINTKLDLREVLEQVTIAISEEIVQCDSVGIYLPQEDGTYRGYVGKPEVINGWTLDMHVIDTEYDLLAKEVIETKKAIYIPDTSKDNRPDPRAVEGFQIKSLFVLPISFEEELFGLVFLFDYGIPMNLTESEIQTIEAYVNMAAVAIQNANNLTYKENLISEKQLLLDVTRDLSMCSTMQQSLDTCFSYLGKVLDNYNVGVHLLDPIAERAIRPAKLSKDSDWTEEDWINTHNKIQIDQSKDRVMQEVMETKKAVLIPDVYADPRPNHDLCRNFGMKGLFMLPLVSLGEVLGQISVVNLDDNNLHYTETQTQLAQSIVDATASTLSNLLYMEKQEVIIEERTSEITVKNQELERVIIELQQLSREKELILNSAGEGIFGLDLNKKITFCNPAGAAMLGYDAKDELIGKHSSLILKNHENDSSNTVQENGNPNHFNKYDKFFRKDNSSFPVEYVISSIKEGNEIVGEVVTFKDITERKQMEEEIKYHAYFDSLTDLPNRVLLKDRLNQGLSFAQMNNQKLAVLYLDLDRFKLVNDTLGHSIGDLLLRDVANRLSACVPNNATVSRQGGDEFTIYLPNIKNENEVLKVVNSVINSFSKSFKLVDNEIYMKTSIGISLYPENGDTSEILIKNADTAMYRSKEISGNSYHFFSEEMDNRTFESIKLENDLYKALEQNELVIFYQPQINSKTNSIEGVEALLRWNHPEKGMISPDKFIPIAEETGLIVSIGEWILKEACKQVKAWHDQGYPLISVSVNLSVRQFEQSNLFSIVKNVLNEVGLSPKYIHLELTENLIVKNTELIVETMKQLKGLGISIAIDDFGTGYSSLGYLKNLPISTLKIDKSFIQDMTKDDAAITNTIITLAKNLNLNVIAEGVEKKEQVDFLYARDCYMMQGYFFSRPMIAEDIAQKYFY
ncbi:bifunctional diguanylate cyclase/phosphodiesterase [Ureibacillus chungkukjangi]|uniref:Diguanylate cyclase/phosphodiesterase with PAS/PAC and GAF sensor(S) n=1 Tax=Ureibacillus chungkukjangi TaxID=1202712 RepID=A0A318TY33_9BACL|nr:EAL domain-containing protein [Ureibacillus chungkukjangi]PYF07918.1 diguanylate cyclase/phosphodiesterase with PAS/PAC and GAF sensor(s) [Ureibacillus chungkukjangi]